MHGTASECHDVVLRNAAGGQRQTATAAVQITDGETMRIYFSGGGGTADVPEALVPERKPHIMLTFYTIDENRTRDRLKAHLAQRKKKK